MSMYKIANLNYIGCYQDKHYRILGGKSTNSKGMTIEKCEDICRNENTQYYGVQASTWCFCGNNLRHSVKKPEGECNYKCDGNKKQNCGGNMRMSMFRHPDYLGCYLDKQYRILGGKSTNSKGMTVEKCKEICWDEYNQFYGLQASTWCFCGNTLRHSDRKPEGECNYKCDGNKNQNCGGSWRMSIYNNPDVDLLVCQ
ncbi:uncharacterized protein LOC134277400 [Saccostrea cucullata]|uniref:uncharacterized protein LOC134277400 n=1 Tax=Saccostrea cuccullata TaxID=36930 RepID=UPI002ED6AE0C